MRFLVILNILIVTLIGCSGEWDHYPIQSSSTQNVQSHIKPGDILSVSIFNEDSLSNDYTVLSDGAIHMPLVDQVILNGSTLDQAKNKIIDAYKNNGYLIDPKVSVSISQTETIFILGEIVNAGEYPFRNGTTILDLIAKSGGFSYRANQDNFDIIRKQSDNKDKIVKGILSTRLQSGDVIRVKERYF